MIADTTIILYRARGIRIPLN